MEDKIPEISIIVPIYNAEDYLEKCVDSICNQTIRNIEIILVDDGSTDASGALCDKYQVRDDRIVVIHKNNEGQYFARLDGVQIARAEYVGFVDADDWIEPNMYEVLLMYARKYDVSVVESGVIDHCGNHDKKRKSVIKEGCYKNEQFDNQIEPYIIYSGDFFSHGVSPYLWSKIFKKISIKIPTNIEKNYSKIYDDIIVVILTILNTKSIYITEDCFYHYCVRAESSKRTRDNKDILGAMKMFENILIHNLFEINMQLREQMHYYIFYRLLLDYPSFFYHKGKHFFLPIPQVKLQNEIIIYGAGVAGATWYKFFEKYVDIVGWVDQEYSYLQQYMPVESPESILNKKYDYIVIAILQKRIADSVRMYLLKMGVPEEKILWVSKEYVENPKNLLKLYD